MFNQAQTPSHTPNVSQLPILSSVLEAGVLQMLLIKMLLVRLFVFKLLLVRLLVGLRFRLLIIMLLLVRLLVLIFLNITIMFFVGIDGDDGTRIFPLAALPGQGPPCPGPDISASPSPAPWLHSTPAPRPPPSRALASAPRLRPSKMSSAPGDDAFRLQLMVHVVDVLLYHMLGGKGTHLSDHHQFVLFHFITLRSDHHIIPL